MDVKVITSSGRALHGTVVRIVSSSATDRPMKLHCAILAVAIAELVTAVETIMGDQTARQALMKDIEEGVTALLKDRDAQACGGLQ